ncbi:hypothetical protein D3C74_258580 [compost metagenome]
MSPGSAADLTGQISDQRRFPLLRRRQDQSVIHRFVPEIQQLRQDGIGDASNLSGNPHVKPTDVAQMLDSSSAQQGSASQSNPMSAGDRNKPFAKLFFHRVERMVRDQIEQTIAVLLARLVRSVRIPRHLSVGR